MSAVTVLAPAKINLHLEVIGLRPDGFHELAMVMQSLDLVDRLEFSNRADGAILLRCEGADLPLDGSNLVVRAAERLRARVGLPELGADLTLEKCIPIGAGLAGGSSDAAATLVGLNALWGLRQSQQQLQGLAAELGSDVPFCLEGGTRLCFGRGERLEPVPQPLTDLGVLLIKDPAAHVSTPWAYGRCRALREDDYLSSEADFEQRRQALRQAPLLAHLARGDALQTLRNDLQAVVEPEVSSVSRGLRLLRGLPSTLAVAMSGSGPTLFALFPGRRQAEEARERLGPALHEAGFDAWSCGCRSRGVSLEAT
ncbi:MAG: 4-(cytidine 5'-diphospho)-2-C-methyl-D-erythritol kinase [Synechococcaceae cyanobacterium]|nr:4-(cytidine 5'-diphospho)-2-C-methyl-D-erythritol kinase [Synechococcaceae cyanobacterium]